MSLTTEKRLLCENISTVREPKMPSCGGGWLLSPLQELKATVHLSCNNHQLING